MRTTQRLLSVAAIGATAVSLAACATSEQPSPQGPGGAGAAALNRPVEMPSGSSSEGATTKEDLFGSACEQLPASGAGSVEAMSKEPVGTAAASNPLLRTLSQAIESAGMEQTLNKQDAQYTVFAPTNSAFAKLPADERQRLLAPSGKQQLADLLGYHLVPQRLDKDGALQAKELTSITGGKLTVGGSGENLTVTNGSGATAKVLCGNVPTANATVFIVDTVLQPS